MGPNHLWVIAVQLAAVYPYFTASRRFFLGRTKVLPWLGLAILLDAAIAVAASTRQVSILAPGETVPWTSALFLLHTLGASIGMFGFVGLFIYLIFIPADRPKAGLRKFQHYFLLPLWLLGVGIGLANFLAKAIFQVRLYNLL